MALYCISLATIGPQHQCNAGWVDPDTPEEFHTIDSAYAKDKREYELVRDAHI